MQEVATERRQLLVVAAHNNTRSAPALPNTIEKEQNKIKHRYSLRPLLEIQPLLLVLDPPARPKLRAEVREQLRVRDEVRVPQHLAPDRLEVHQRAAPRVVAHLPVAHRDGVVRARLRAPVRRCRRGDARLREGEDPGRGVVDPAPPEAERLVRIRAGRGRPCGPARAGEAERPRE